MSSDTPNHRTILQYCEDGNTVPTSSCAEQYKYSQTGINPSSLNILGWLMQSLPYKKIRSIIVCGEHYRYQVEFAAYVAYNQANGFLREVGSSMDPKGVVVEILPTGNSSNRDKERFDPPGFYSYSRRHALFPSWRRCFVATCNVTTGKTEPLQLEVPDRTVEGHPVERCFFSNTDTTSKYKTDLVCSSLLDAVHRLLDRIQGAPEIKQCIGNRFPRVFPVRPQAFLGAFFHIDVLDTNLEIMRSKALITNPCLRIKFDRTFITEVGVKVSAPQARSIIVSWDASLKVGETRPEEVRKEFKHITISGIEYEDGSRDDFRRHYRQDNKTNHFKTDDDRVLFLYQEDSIACWVVSNEETYEMYQQSLQNKQPFDKRKATFTLISSRLPSTLKLASQIGSRMIQWYKFVQVDPSYQAPEGKDHSDELQSMSQREIAKHRKILVKYARLQRRFDEVSTLVENDERELKDLQERMAENETSRHGLTEQLDEICTSHPEFQ